MEPLPLTSLAERRDDRWTEGRGRVLLRIARDSLNEALGVGIAADYRDAARLRPAADIDEGQLGIVAP